MLGLSPRFDDAARKRSSVPAFSPQEHLRAQSWIIGKGNQIKFDPHQLSERYAQALRDQSVHLVQNRHVVESS
ncbi:hypothetical protein A8W25_14400 [Streptomyces sp. ERV7]|nr:hypothetical protein A8W25_14400 [Streptomyces sp. ERV7]